MQVISDMPRKYKDRNSSPPRVWCSPSPGYRKQGDGGLCTIREPAAADLQTLLDRVSGKAFFSKVLANLFEGREASSFAQNILISELAAAVRFTRNSQALVERALDGLFQDFEAGRTFVHTEVVMAILFALKRSGVSYAHEIIEGFSEARHSELAYLARFARSLKRR